MIDFILNQNVFVYVITAIGICGIVARIIIGGYLSGMIKATENMGNTRKKPLGEIRKRYEELVSLNVDIQDIQSFVGRYIGKMKLLKIKISSWNNFTKNMMLLAAGTGIAGGYTIFRLTGEAYQGLDTGLYGLVVCGIMAVVWNICDCKTKQDNLAYGIENYLENSLANRLKKESMKQAAATMRSDIHVIDIDEKLNMEQPKQIKGDAVKKRKNGKNKITVTNTSENNMQYCEEAGDIENEGNNEYIVKNTGTVKKRRDKGKERKVTQEQIAACDALFDNLVNGMINNNKISPEL